MSLGFSVLHSHSVLERELNFPKHTVLIDGCFSPVVHSKGGKTVPFHIRNKAYAKVSVPDFVRAGGVFKNFSE